MKDGMLELGDETIQNSESNLQIEHGITDFWTQNSSYKMLIESDGIAKIDSRELKIAINKNLQKLFGSEFNYDIKICQLFNDNANIFCNETNGNESEIQIVFMWRFLHYWPKSIAAKMNFSKIKINKVLSKHKALARKQGVKNFKTKAGGNSIINEDHIEMIKQYIESTHYKPIKLNMIKNAVWPINSSERPPWKSTISKILKKRLKMSYKVLHKWNTKRRDPQNQRIFMESLYFQTKFRVTEIEAIYIDEFKFSSRN